MIKMRSKAVAMSFHIPLFQDMSTETLVTLEPLFQNFSCPPDTALFEQGDKAVHFYLILKGTVAIRFKPYDGPPIKLTQLHDGDLCGWSAVIGSKFYTSGCVSLTRVDAIKIIGKDLWQFVKAHPETGRMVMERFAKTVSSRWKNSADEVHVMLDHIMKEMDDKK